MSTTYVQFNNSRWIYNSVKEMPADNICDVILKIAAGVIAILAMIPALIIDIAFCVYNELCVVPFNRGVRQIDRTVEHQEPYTEQVEEPQMEPYYEPLAQQYYGRLSLQFSNSEGVNLELGNFRGNVSNAMKYLQDFCNSNVVEIESYGRDYGALFVNGQKHSYTPYGIDLKMMLEFCGGKTPDDFPALPQA